MKEIKILIQQLRNYPNNLFVHPADYTNDELEDEELAGKIGLDIVDKDGNWQGFIRTGINDRTVITE
ncbi:hypothetical protein LCGC14_0393180 [marine sediment metagenome]|uniref:Uncharacterized protein n=1 Tax=marine sediment metagenome TaxID=412755 RepID=A0A0F9TH39_9ZZZZ